VVRPRPPAHRVVGEVERPVLHPHHLRSLTTQGRCRSVGPHAAWMRSRRAGGITSMGQRCSGWWCSASAGCRLRSSAPVGPAGAVPRRDQLRILLFRLETRSSWARLPRKMPAISAKWQYPPGSDADHRQRDWRSEIHPDAAGLPASTPLMQADPGGRGRGNLAPKTSQLRTGLRINRNGSAMRRQYRP